MVLTRRMMLLGSAGAFATLYVGCTSVPQFVADALLPDAPPYPFQDPAQVNDEARAISARLETFIEAWLDGTGPARLPDDLIPPGADPLPTNLRLVAAEDVDPGDLWGIRGAHEIDFDNSPGLYPDPNCTYLMAAPFFLPFGATAVIEGEFPHARFFSVQVTPPFDPRYYYYGTAFGAVEVPIVDADIDPLPGHTNPFRIGADRQATKRSYKVELEMVQGYGPAIEPAYNPPHYRAAGNRRKASGLVYQGPMGLPEYKIGHGRGLWDFGALWIRYYAPDRERGPLAGVPLPKITYRTAGGRPFGMIADIAAKRADTNRSGPIPRSDPEPPRMELPGQPIIWFRELDILHTGLSAIFQATGKTSTEDKAQGRALIKGLVAHGTDVPAPGPWMGSASRVPYISYLSGGGSVDEGQVLVFSGRLPQHPRTLNGDRRMQGGQVRYVSITSYVVADFLGDGVIGQPVSSIMDEEIVTDANGRYILCYSRAENRPSNATAEAGVTWINWGPIGTANFNLRWMTVNGGWKDRTITPDDAAISYAQASWFDEGFDVSLVGTNGKSRVMGEYLPTLRYLSREAFEALGQAPDVAALPVWNG
jgi:hypothetical protein